MNSEIAVAKFQMTRPLAPGQGILDIHGSGAGRTFFTMLAATLVLFTTSAQARIACQASKPHARSYYAWREIDHRRCWYAGAPGLSKAVLYWPSAEPPSYPLPVPAVPIAVAPVPAVTLPARTAPFAERWPQ
jgi:hypothetical protein